jgi:electron transport complex protein RnfB
MLTLIVIMSAIVFLLGAVLAFARFSFRVDKIPLADRIDNILPQTQCGKCGYPGCRPYAEAVANKQADINKCPPGGEEGIRDLANLLGVSFKPFDADVVLKPPAVAFIDENICIGCTLCLQACPVDAISGASKQMHTIIAPLCTGCELCVEPCPVDCIDMLPLPQQILSRDQKRATAKAARQRYGFRLERIERDKREKAERLPQKAKPAEKPVALEADAQALIQAALERAKAQAAAVKPQNTEQLTPAQQAQIDEIEVRRAKAKE